VDLTQLVVQVAPVDKVEPVETVTQPSVQVELAEPAAKAEQAQAIMEPV
jgi:hypothetical protein